MTDIPTTKTTLNRTGSVVTYVAQFAGTIGVKLWGAGGGSGFNTTIATANIGAGGPGGFTSVSVAVNSGDTVTFYVASGGNQAALNNGGAGGDPGGGFGGISVSGANGFNGGGGGGFSWMKVNGSYVAIAAGGGGGRGTANTAGVANGAARGGNGGGTTGGPGYGQNNSNTISLGGDQSSGGSGGTAGGSAAAQFQGGNGGPTQTTNAGTAKGGGGGGGWYGGASGANSGLTTNGGGGAGGSSWFSSNTSLVVSGSTTSGSSAAGGFNAPGGVGDSDYPGGGVGNGGDKGSNAGNSGAIVITSFVQAGNPAAASGDVGTLTLTTPSGIGTVPISLSVAVGTLTLSTPAGSGTGGGTGSGAGATIIMFEPTGSAGVSSSIAGSLGTLNLTVTTASAGARVDASATIGTITLNGSDLGGQGFAEAFISIAVADADITLTEPSGSVHIPANPSPTFPSSIQLTVPTITIPGITTGGIGTLTLTAPAGTGAEIIDAFGSLSTITLTAPDLTFQIGGTGIGDISTLSATAPEATAYSFIVGTGSLAEIDLSPPLGTAGNGALAFPGPITLTEPNGSADIGPFEGLLATITLMPPVGEFVNYATGSLPTITLATVDGSWSDGTAHPTGSIGTIMLTEPVGEFNWIGYAQPFTDITLTRPAGAATGDAHTPGDIASTIVLSRPLADATGAVMVSFNDNLFINLTSTQAAQVNAVTLLASILPAKITLRVPAGLGGPANSGAGNADFGTLAINVASPEGYIYVDTPGWAGILMKRSLTPGNTPTLVSREIAINESDGSLYTRDGTGALQATPLAAIQNGAFVPIDATDGYLLRGDNSWGAVQPAYTQPVRLQLPEQNVVLSENLLGTTTNRVLSSDTIYYRPFFIPKTVTLTNVAVEVMVAASATAHIGICKWILPQMPDIAVLSDAVSCATTGVKNSQLAVTLTPGWYAAMIAITGTGAPTLKGHDAPIRMASDFSASGDPTGVYTSNLSSLGSPTGRAAFSAAFLTADSANV